MPLDRTGRKVHTGDIVNVPCIVKGVEHSAELYNVVLETVEPFYPGENKTWMTLNATQVDLLESLGQSCDDIDIATAIQNRKEESGVLSLGRSGAQKVI